MTGLIENGETQLGLLFVCCEGQEPMEMVVLQLHHFKILQEYLLLAVSYLIANYW